MNTAYALFDKTNQKITFKYPVDMTTTTMSLSNLIMTQGTAASPAIGFSGDTNTGLFSPATDNFAVTTSGTERIRILADGKVGINKTTPAEVLDVAGNIQLTAGQYFAPLGLVTAPTYSFTGDANTGIYSPAADQVAITTGGTQRVLVSTGNVTSTLNVIAPVGAVGTPSYTFSGRTNTGVYSPAANQVAVTTGGTQRMLIDSTGTTTTVPFLPALGTATAPSYSFTGDTNTGIFSPAADQVAITTGGTQRVAVDGSGNVSITSGNVTVTNEVIAKNTWRTAYNTNILTNLTTTFADAITFPVSAGYVYAVRGKIWWRPRGTTPTIGGKFRCIFDTAVSGDGFIHFKTTTGSTTSAFLTQLGYYGTQPNVTVATTTEALPNLLEFEGVFLADTATGNTTFKVQYAQNTANAGTSITVYLGSYVEYRILTMGTTTYPAAPYNSDGNFNHLYLDY